jgi:16S rRNA (guanine527-N7)-methyltransferase
MRPAGIADLLRPFLSPATTPWHFESGPRLGEESAALSPVQLQHISTYIDILLRWSARINLTAIRDPEAIVTRHFGESLFAARHLFPNSASIASARSRALDAEAEGNAGGQLRASRERLADLGAGAGFPGLPIKIWAPAIVLTLIESNQKKATFLREVSRALTLTDINVQNARAETLVPASFEVVTLRAVERFSRVLPVAARLLAPGGRLALLIASSQLDQVHSTLPQLAWQPPIPVPESESRLLLMGRL